MESLKQYDERTNGMGTCLLEQSLIGMRRTLVLLRDPDGFTEIYFKPEIVKQLSSIIGCVSNLRYSEILRDKKLNAEYPRDVVSYKEKVIKDLVGITADSDLLEVIIDLTKSYFTFKYDTI